jgi:hypothetical protein
MKISPILRLLFVLFTAVALCGIASSTPAQSAETDTVGYRFIVIHHVPSDLMAYWLDPTHHPAVRFQKQLDAAGPQAPTFHPAPEPALENGKATIASIIAPENGLLIYSDQTLYDHLKSEIAALDKPIPGIKLDATAAPMIPQHINSDTSGKPDSLQWRQIPVKNIRPGMLAYWIDPAHQSKPIEYQKANDEMNQYPMVKEKESWPKINIDDLASKASVLNKPLNSTLFADDANNTIWVRSTQNDFDQLQKMVEFLDRPIRKIDFDIKMVEVDSADIPAIQNNSTLKALFNPSTRRGFAPINAETALDDLIKNGDAKIAKSIRLTIPNNLTDALNTKTSAPVTVDIKQAAGGSQILTTQSDEDNPLFLEKRFSLVLTPTINNDDTITIFMSPTASAELTHQTPEATDDQLWIQSLDHKKAMTTVFTLRNGNSLLFTGYDSTSLGLDDQGHPAVLWLKAEIEK